ncbi:MAG: DUF3326 domain-containing protein [Synechococcales bacterium]|nr:DUF3326 domain-containing protein [Synechococcales bacterium]
MSPIRSQSSPFTVMLIVPTGIGAAMGGYAGDALPMARAIAQIADCLITHPNVLNGAQLYWPMENVLYVEGYGLDQVAAGRWGLRPVRQNRVGLLLDRGIEPELRLRHLQVADAARATLGLELADYVVTDAPLGVSLSQAKSGATWGTIQRPDSLLRAAERLITQAGAEAIAVVARFPDDEDSENFHHYRQGQGVDPLAGAEAVISHLVVRTFHVPCAHAPALAPLDVDPQVSPRTAAEELGYTFLPCVLVGLSRAPQFVTNPDCRSTAPALWADQVDALVVPATACGGSAVLSLASTRTRILAVAENTTTMQTPPEALGIPALRLQSYMEALGALVALKAGVSLDALRPQVLALQPLPDIPLSRAKGDRPPSSFIPSMPSPL